MGYFRPTPRSSKSFIRITSKVPYGGIYTSAAVLQFITAKVDLVLQQTNLDTDTAFILFIFFITIV